VRGGWAGVTAQGADRCAHRPVDVLGAVPQRFGRSRVVDLVVGGIDVGNLAADTRSCGDYRAGPHRDVVPAGICVSASGHARRRTGRANEGDQPGEFQQEEAAPGGTGLQQQRLMQVLPPSGQEQVCRVHQGAAQLAAGERSGGRAHSGERLSGGAGHRGPRDRGSARAGDGEPSGHGGRETCHITSGQPFSDDRPEQVRDEAGSRPPADLPRRDPVRTGHERRQVQGMVMARQLLKK
jgi:hypothetical protein